MFFSVLCLLCLCARLFICALWSPAGKGLIFAPLLTLRNLQTHTVNYLLQKLYDVKSILFFSSTKIQYYSHHVSKFHNNTLVIMQNTAYLI